MTRREPCICGIDPGSASGAIAFYSPNASHLVTVEDLPFVAGNVDSATLKNRLLQIGPDFVVLEDVGVRPGQGISSSGKFMKAVGRIEGVIAALEIPLYYAAPTKWKKSFGLDSDKEKSRALALRYWPERSAQFARKKDADRAEAALIARFGVRFMTPVAEEAA